MTGTQPKVFSGWWVALTAALGLFLNTATIVVFPFGIFAKAIGQEFHSGRARISLAFTIHNLTAALCVPLAGRLVDQVWSAKSAPSIHRPLGLDPGFQQGFVWGDMATLRLLFGFGFKSPAAPARCQYTDVVSHWFDRHPRTRSERHDVSGWVWVQSPFLQWRSGWSQRLDGAPLTVCSGPLRFLLIPLPVVAAFLKEKPESMGLLPDGGAEAHASTPVAANEIGLTLREAVHTSAFWIMVSVLFLVTASVHACFIHLPAILADRGSTARLAAFASSLFGVGLFIGRVGCGYLLDQFFAPRVASVLFSSVAIGIAFLGVGHTSIWSAFIAALASRSRHRRRGRHYCVLDKPLLWAALIWSDFRLDMGRLWLIWRIGDLPDGFRSIRQVPMLCP